MAAAVRSMTPSITIGFLNARSSVSSFTRSAYRPCANAAPLPASRANARPDAFVLIIEASFFVARGSGPSGPAFFPCDLSNTAESSDHQTVGTRRGLETVERERRDRKRGRSRKHHLRHHQADRRGEHVAVAAEARGLEIAVETRYRPEERMAVGRSVVVAVDEPLDSHVRERRHHRKEERRDLLGIGPVVFLLFRLPQIAHVDDTVDELLSG